MLLLLPQPPARGGEYTLNLAAESEKLGETLSRRLDIPVVPDAHRLGFDVRAFARQWGLDGAKGGGVHMWREVWSADVSTVYKEILSECLVVAFLILFLLRVA